MKARDLAQGKWRGILPQLGVPAAVLDGKHHPCPATGQGDDRFRFADRNGSGNYFCCDSEGRNGGLSLLMHVHGWSYAEAAREVERVVGYVKEDAPRQKRDPRNALNRVRRLVKPAGLEVARYLKRRGLELAPGIKQARLTYWEDGRQAGVFDCMIGLILSPQNRPQSYHITYLQDGEKAPVRAQRKMMTPVDTVKGGAVRLYPAAARMGVAEGIETAIAAHMMSGLPVWAAINAGNLEYFQPPKVCEHLTIFGDTDTSYTGQAAAYVLARRMVKAGIACDVSLPPEGDWNDELQRRAA